MSKVVSRRCAVVLCSTLPADSAFRLARARSCMARVETSCRFSAILKSLLTALLRRSPRVRPTPISRKPRISSLSFSGLTKTTPSTPARTVEASGACVPCTTGARSSLTGASNRDTSCCCSRGNFSSSSVARSTSRGLPVLCETLRASSARCPASDNEGSGPRSPGWSAYSKPSPSFGVRPIPPGSADGASPRGKTAST